jgi:acyl-CoA synthetase (AMP-forming)/AMP-acid ligase II
VKKVDSRRGQLVRRQPTNLCNPRRVMGGAVWCVGGGQCLDLFNHTEKIRKAERISPVRTFRIAPLHSENFWSLRTSNSTGLAQNCLLLAHDPVTNQLFLPATHTFFLRGRHVTTTVTTAPLDHCHLSRSPLSPLSHRICEQTT